MQSLRYEHVDVFAAQPYAGNSLPVFTEADGLDHAQMLAISRELRHFETIFLTPTDRPQSFGARIFDQLGELPFAGHPLIGAAAALHRKFSPELATLEWKFQLVERSVGVSTIRTSESFFGLLDQGRATFLGECRRRREIAAAVALNEDELDPTLPLEVISTGLPYLIVPVRPGVLGRARIERDITALLEETGAQFAVLLDEARREIRHWNNDGQVEDIATGSAAGTIGAYLLRHGRTRSGERFVLYQGQHVGRASKIDVKASGSPDLVHTVKVGGLVAMVGWGALQRPRTISDTAELWPKITATTPLII